MRRPHLLLVVVLVLGASVTQPESAPAQAPAPGAALVEVCRASGVLEVPELGPRACRSIDAGATLAAQACALLPLPPDACANLTDGRLIDPARIDAFEGSWVWRALRLQDRLDDREPLHATLWPHTHNSSNSTAYAPALTNIDPNQRYSLADQLRMGIRAVELDIHWAPNPAGTLATGLKAVILCHGRTEGVGDLLIHLGCSVDRLLVDGLRELRSFLDAPGNEAEVVLLYLENQLEDDPLAHGLAAAAIETELGALVVRPPADQPCAEMPLDQSTDDLRARGGRVLIVGNCGPGAWGSWVHERGERWDESGSGGSYPAFPACIEAERGPEQYDGRWTRRYEDSTWLTAMVDGPAPPVDADDVRSMVRCGVDMVGFDRLEPFDGRLEALVWSWAPDEPVDDPARRCVGGDADGRFRMAPCGEARRFACRGADGTWVVPTATGPASDAEAVCGSAAATAGTPATGWDNEGLRAASGGDPVWLALGALEVGIGDLEPADVGTQGGRARSAAGALPATGGPNATAWVATLLLLAGLLLSGATGARPTPPRRP